MILDTIFDTFKSTSIRDAKISTFDINHQLYVFLSSFVNSLFDFFIDQLFDHQLINFIKRNSSNVIIDQKRHLSTIFQVFERCWFYI
jgi:hypothetical protein